MDVAELFEIALANSDRGRVEVTALESAEIASDVVGALTEMIFELVANATAFSPLEETVHIAGLFEGDGYLISISDRGVGIPPSEIEVLNRSLEDPTAGERLATLGIPIVARLATRHAIDVKLVPGVPGTTARVTLPPELVTRRGQLSPDIGPPATREPEPVKSDADSSSGSERPVEEPILDTEAFLESIFGPLMRDSSVSRPPVASGSGGVVAGIDDVPLPPTVEGTTRGTATALRVRVPGANFGGVEDAASVAPGEAAVDIRKALYEYEEGRRSASESGDLPS